MKLQTETGNFWCGEYDTFGVCKDGYIWYDGVDSYGMARARDVGADFFPHVLSVAFQKNWTTPEELYIDSQKCAFTAESAEQYNATDLEIGCAVSSTLRGKKPSRAPFHNYAGGGASSNTHSSVSRTPRSASSICPSTWAQPSIPTTRVLCSSTAPLCWAGAWTTGTARHTFPSPTLDH